MVDAQREFIVRSIKSSDTVGCKIADFVNSEALNFRLSVDNDGVGRNRLFSSAVLVNGERIRNSHFVDLAPLGKLSKALFFKAELLY